MSHKNRNPVNPVNRGQPKRIAAVLSNSAVSTTLGTAVGFWWAELSHTYFAFTEAGYEVELFSPEGGKCAPDAMSDPEDASRWQAEDELKALGANYIQAACGGDSRSVTATSSPASRTSAAASSPRWSSTRSDDSPRRDHRSRVAGGE